MVCTFLLYEKKNIKNFFQDYTALGNDSGGKLGNAGRDLKISLSFFLAICKAGGSCTLRLLLFYYLNWIMVK